MMTARAVPPSVLLVDDEQATCRLVAMLLGGLGYRVQTAANGQQGLEVARREAPDVILLDVVMPVLNGLDVLRYLKQSPALQHVPVVMVTAKGSEADIEQCIRLGAVGHLEKPYEIEALIQQIEAALCQPMNGHGAGPDR